MRIKARKMARLRCNAAIRSIKIMISPLKSKVNLVHRGAGQDGLWETVFMPKRDLRIVKWMGSTPAIGVCEFCSRQFKTPMSALTRTADAQANLQEQFDRHKCKREDASQTAERFVGEATKD